MQFATRAISEAGDVPLCRLCGSTLHPAHAALGVCAWCISAQTRTGGPVTRSPGYGFSRHGKAKSQDPLPE